MGFTGKYITCKIHKNYIQDPREFMDDLISVISFYYLSMSFCLYNKKNITRWLEDMNFIFEWQNNILRTSAASE